MIWNWQCDTVNAGQFLNKYTVVVLLHQATENCLSKPGIIQHGFARAGLVPWNKDSPDITKLLPGTIFADSNQMESSNYEVNADILDHIPIADFAHRPDDLTNSIPIPEESLDAQVRLNTTTMDVSEDHLQTPSPSIGQLNISQSEHSPPSSSEAHSTPSGMTDPPSFHGPSLDILSDSDNAGVMDSQPSHVTSNHDDNNRSLKCPQCSRGIPQMVFEIHQAICSSNNPTPIEPVPELKTVPNLNLKERERQLHKFEFLLLSEETVEEFNQLFADRKLEIQEPLFQSWLILKNASSLPTEDQALKKVLEDHTASNVPKKKTNRKRNVPIGPARYDPSSPEWEEILKDQAAKKRKENVTTKKPPKTTQKKKQVDPKQKTAKTSKRKLRL